MIDFDFDFYIFLSLRIADIGAIGAGELAERLAGLVWIRETPNLKNQ